MSDYDLNNGYENKFSVEIPQHALTVEGYDLSALTGSSNLIQSTGNGRVTDTCSTPDPTKYHDPSTQFTSITRSPLTSKIPMRYGLNGVVVPRATSFGASQGFNPYKQKSRVPSVSVDFNKITRDMAKEAIRVVNTVAEEVDNIDDLRAKQAATFNVLHQMQKKGDTVKFGSDNSQLQIKQAQPQQISNSTVSPQQFIKNVQAPQGWESEYNHVNSGQMPAQPPTMPYVKQNTSHETMMSVFNGNTNSPTKQILPIQQAPSLGPIPTKRATFAFPDGSKQVGLFHSIIHQPSASGDLGVLVFGLRVDYNGPRFEPSSTSETPLAVIIDGVDRVYRVEMMGIKYVHNGEELNHAMIVQEVPLNN